MDVEKLRGAMIIDVGADTTEISVLSLGGIVVSKLLPSVEMNWICLFEVMCARNTTFDRL